MGIYISGRMTSMANNTNNTDATNLIDNQQAQIGAQQYGRAINLVVYGNNQADSALQAGGQLPANESIGIEFSQFRIKFSVKRSNSMTPNTADIRVYNVDLQTALRVRDAYKRIVLQAGYTGNFGVIFQGNIKQVIIGRESATDTFMDLVCGDGDLGYNFAIVNGTLAAGSSALDQVNASATAMSGKGVGTGHIGEMPTTQLPRGKVMYGNARNYLRDVAVSTNKTWSIQNEKITFVPNKSYLPGERVILTSKTGMIGTPQQTNEGINAKCLLNPRIPVGGRIQIDNKSVEQFKINLGVINSPANIPAPTTVDGVYFVLVVEHSGDTRGVDWYTNLTCLNIDVTTNPINSVQVNYG